MLFSVFHDFLCTQFPVSVSLFFYVLVFGLGFSCMKCSSFLTAIKLPSFVHPFELRVLPLGPTSPCHTVLLDRMAWAWNTASRHSWGSMAAIDAITSREPHLLQLLTVVKEEQQGSRESRSSPGSGHQDFLLSIHRYSSSNPVCNFHLHCRGAQQLFWCCMRWSAQPH